MKNIGKILSLSLLATAGFCGSLYAQCVESIGSSANMLTSLQNRQNSIIVNNDLNTVLFIHRNDNSIFGGDNGLFRYDISTDNGATWQKDLGGLNLGSTAGVNSGRFPQVGLYNPPANTNPANAKLVYHGPTIALDGFVGDWNGYVTGSLALDGAASPTENYNQAGVSNTFWPGGFCQSSPGIFWTVDIISDEINGTLGFRILKGTYNGSDVVWTVNAEFNPDFNTDFGSPFVSDWNMAFDPSGMKGWMVALTHLNPLTGNSYRPVFYKTVDGGITWSGPEQLDLTTFGNITALESNPTCGTEVDIEVDVNGNPHALIGVFKSTSFYNVDPSAVGHLFDFTYNGAWSATNVAQLSYHSLFYNNSGSLTNRPQISRSDDGTKMVFTYTESDLPSSQGVFPDLKAITYDVASGNFSCPVSYSHLCPSLLDGQMYQTTVSPIMLEVGGVFTVPVVLTIANASGDGIDPAQHYYLNGLSFTAADFMNLATPSSLTISAGGPIKFCAGGSVELTASSANSYLWNTGETTQTITATGGNYWVIDPAESTCIGSGNSISVTQVETPFLFPSFPVICPGGSVDIFVFSFNTPVYGSYLWTTGETTEFITVTSAGTYDVLVDGCPSFGPVVITEPGAPTNDNICGAQALTSGTTTSFTNFCSSAELNEPVPPIGTDPTNGSCNSQDGWCDYPGVEPAVTNSVWFSFIAPASKAVEIKATNIDFYADYQLALYESSDQTCNGQLTLVAANDNDLNDWTSSTLSAYCLKNGRKYYVQVDGGFGSTGEGVISLTDIPNTITLCHKGKTISVSGCAMAAHLAHGDVLGSCIEDLRISYSNAEDVNKLLVYPNPTADLLNVSFIMDKEDEYTMSVVDGLGRVILSQTGTAVEGDNDQTLELKSLTSGIYLLILKRGDSMSYARIVKE